MTLKITIRELDAPIPDKWKLFVTDESRSMVETQVAKMAVDLINSFKAAFQDFTKARRFLKAVYTDHDATKADVPAMKRKSCLKSQRKFPEAVTDKDIYDIIHLSPVARNLLKGDVFAVLDWPLNHSVEIGPRDGL